MMDLTQTDLLKPAAKNSAPPSKKLLNYTTLFWHPTGPLIAYSKGILHIEDLNPQLSTKWRMSRAELFKLGWHCIRASLR